VAIKSLVADLEGENMICDEIIQLIRRMKNCSREKIDIDFVVRLWFFQRMVQQVIFSEDEEMANRHNRKLSGLGKKRRAPIERRVLGLIGTDKGVVRITKEKNAHGAWSLVFRLRYDRAPVNYPLRDVVRMLCPHFFNEGQLEFQESVKPQTER